MTSTFVLTAVLVAALALALSLWRRGTAARRELVALRSELEARVDQRTAELAERTRELAEANDTRSRFFARVSHEIRTPLSGILGINRMLMQTGLEGRQRELAEIVQAQGGTLLTIINDILDYSKMEAGRFGLAASDFSLRDTIDEAARIHGEQARAKHVGFVVDVDPSLPSHAYGDAVRLGRSWTTCCRTPSSSPTAARSSSAPRAWPPIPPTSSPASKSPIPASAWAPRPRACCSSRSFRPTARPRGGTAAPDWGLRSPRAWSR